MFVYTDKYHSASYILFISFAQGTVYISHPLLLNVAQSIETVYNNFTCCFINKYLMYVYSP